MNTLASKRNGNIELLRCFLMFCIVLGHVCCHGPYARTTVGLGCNTLTLFAVDAFAFISGWFSVRTSFMRVIRFLGYGLFAYLTIWAISQVWDCGCAGGMTMGWYGNSYFVVMLLASLINAGIDKMSNDYGNRSIMIILLTYLGFMFLQWLPFRHIQVFDQVQWSSHSAMLLLGMYLTGRVLKKIEIVHRPGFLIPLMIFFGCECFVIAWSGFTVGRLHDIKMWDYRSPIMLLSAVSIFLIFLKAKIPLLFQRTAIFLAPSMFVVYLLHDGTGRDVSSLLFSKVEVYMVETLSLNLVVAFLSTAIVVFLVCVMIDLLRRLVFSCLSCCIKALRRSK